MQEARHHALDPPQVVNALQGAPHGTARSAETLFAQAGVLEGVDPDAAGEVPDTESAIKADAKLSESQKQALLTVYRSYLAENR